MNKFLTLEDQMKEKLLHHCTILKTNFYFFLKSGILLDIIKTVHLNTSGYNDAYSQVCALLSNEDRVKIFSWDISIWADELRKRHSNQRTLLESAVLDLSQNCRGTYKNHTQLLLY